MKKRKMISIMVVFAMIVSMITIPSSAYADSAKISIITENITNKTSEIEVNITELPSLGILRVIEMDAGDDYDSSRLNNYTSLNFSLPKDLKIGSNTLTLTAKPEAGRKVMAVIRDSSGSSVLDYVSNAVTFDGEIYAGDTSVKVNITGDIPDETNLLVKIFDAGTKDADISVSGGTYAGSVQNVSSGSEPVTVTAADGVLASGKKLAAFLMNAENVIAVSETVTITETIDFTIEHSGLITTETDSVEIDVTARPGMEDTNINIVGLCRVVDGKTDITSPDSYITRAFGQKPGKIKLTGISDLKVGERLRFVIRYMKNGELIALEGPDITVTEPLAENSMIINESGFTVDSDKVTVTISGYDSFIGCALIINTGKPSSNGDSDSRTRLASQKFTGSGVYEFTIDHSKLKGGDTIQATLALAK